MSKLYDKELLYIPSDLVGNVLDKIRKKFGLEQGITLETDISHIAFSGNGNNVSFKKDAKKSRGGIAVYDFRVDDFTASKEIKEKFEALQSKVGVLLASIIMGAVVYGSIKKLIGTPILDQDLFFDTSFLAGEIRDKSMLPATDAIPKEPVAKTESAEGLYYSYKIQSHFTKYVANDPYSRFSGNVTQDSDLVPSFYEFIESNYYEPFGGKLIPKSTRRNLNYSLLETAKLGHMAFFDYGTYTTFLMGCADLAKNKLRSVAKYNENLIVQDITPPTTELQDYLPFYVKIEFPTEKNVSDSGFSFSHFLNTPTIRPFFEQFMGLYVDLVENPKKYENKSWLDSSEEFSIFDRETGKLHDKFDTKVITAAELVKDPDVLNFKLGKQTGTEACANIQKKISTLLFDKKVGELMASTLQDGDDVFKNPNYSETICYRVTRTDKFTGKVTHWFVPNFPSLQQVELFDTNLRFNRGQDAHYEVFSLKACVALNYEYKTHTGQTKGDKYKTSKKWMATGYERETPIPGKSKYVHCGEQWFMGKLVEDCWEAEKLAKKDPDTGKPLPPHHEKGDLIYETIEDTTDLINAELIMDKMSDKNPVADLKFTAYVKPSVNFVEVPYFSKDDVVIYDSAPARPTIRLFAYRGVDNKTTALFSGYVDQYKAKREPILLGDGLINNDAEKYARQFYNFAKDELYYKSDMGDVDFFELFVLETPPRTLKDFRNATKIRIKNSSKPLVKAALAATGEPYGTSYTLDIEPNKNYWLMARVVDFNQNISNASEIFKVRIVNDDGYINPTFQLFDMKKQELPKEVDASPEFMKLVYVAPSPEHVQPYLVGNILTVGNDDSQPYTKSYKIRIKSKKTNKKLDINVYFDYAVQNIKTAEELPSAYEYNMIDFGDGV